MDIQIIDTPYDDRYCGNCSRCIKGELNYCLQNKAYVVSKKWCIEWLPEFRNYKFEN